MLHVIGIEEAIYKIDTYHSFIVKCRVFFSFFPSLLSLIEYKKMDFTDYLRILGWVLTAAFPLVVVYLTGGPDKEPLLDDVEYERRKRIKELAAKREAGEKRAQLEASKESPKKSNKKKSNKKSKATTAEVVQDGKNKVAEQPQQEQQLKKRKNANKEEQQRDIVPAVVTKEEEDKKLSKKEKKKAAAIVAEEKKPLLANEDREEEVDQEKVKEIDEHMDPTANYARVMRIKPEEEEDEWEAVPAEEGWSQVKSKWFRMSSPSIEWVN